MIVICPKCQFENNAETARVVCARCATLIDVGHPQESAPASHWGTAELPPRVTMPMSDLPASALPGGALRRDPYATRIEPDADEVLDIPRVSNGIYPIAESGAVFDEVLAAPPGQPMVPATESMPVVSPPVVSHANDHANDFASAAGFDALPEDEPLQFAPTPAVVMPFPRRDDDPLLIEPELQPAPSADWPELPMQNEAWASNGAAGTNHNDWPMLPEESMAAHNSADNPIFNSGGKRRLLVSLLLAALIFVGLSAGAWYFLSGKLSKKDQIAKGEKSASGLAVKSPGAAPSVAPSGSSAVKPGAAVDTKAATAPTASSPQTSPEPAKPAPSEAAKKTDVTPHAVQPGPSGPSVDRNEGSLTLQFGSYNNQNEATQRVSTLKSAGVEARVVRAEIPGKGTWYRVQAGRFTSRDEASRYAAQLKARGSIKEFMVTGYQAN